MKNQTVENLNNRIELLKKALEFYANKDNYNQNIPANNELSSKIELDEGYQARFTLEQVGQLDTYMEELNEKVDEINKSSDSLDSTKEVDSTLSQRINDIKINVKNLKDQYGL